MWQQQPDYAPYKEKLTVRAAWDPFLNRHVGEQRAIALLLTSHLSWAVASCFAFELLAKRQSCQMPRPPTDTHAASYQLNDKHIYYLKFKFSIPLSRFSQ